MMLKVILVYASQINGTLNLSFCMNFLKFSNKIAREWSKHHLACDCVHPCAKFEVSRRTSVLRVDSLIRYGRERDCFITIIIFIYITWHTDDICEGFKRDFEQF